MEKFDHKYQEHDKKIDYLERRIDELKRLSKVIERLDARIDDGELYSRRMCLRFNGVSVPAESSKEDCAERVYDILKGMGVDLPENAIDRAHRIGRISEQGKQQIIVRFKSFRAWYLVYKKRKKCKKASIFLGLTKKRLAHLSWAKEAIRPEWILHLLI